MDVQARIIKMFHGKFSAIGLTFALMMFFLVHILPKILGLSDGNALSWVLNPILLMVFAELQSLHPVVAEWYWAICEPLIYLKWYAVGFIVELVFRHEVRF